MKITFTLIFAVFYIGGLLYFGYMHEQVHVVIFERDGIKTKVNYLAFPDFETIAEEPCRTETCRLSNNLNEIVGYPLMILYTFFGMGLLFIILLLERR